MANVNPGYIDPTIFESNNLRLGEGDVIVNCPMKSGTNWMMNIVYQMLNNADMSFDDIYKVCPWLEFVDYKGQTNDERIEKLNNYKGFNGRRCFKSHMPTPPLPFKDDVKYVIVVRNPKDVSISAYHFLRAHNPEFLKYWDFYFPIEKAQDVWPMLEYGPMLYPFIQCWYALRNKPNVLLLHYGNLLEDLTREMKKVHDFLGLNLSEDVFKKCVHHSTFQQMKENEHKYLASSLGPIINGKNAFLLLPGSMVRSGISGDSVKSFTPEEHKYLDELIISKFPDPIMRNWVMNGGEVPK